MTVDVGVTVTPAEAKECIVNRVGFLEEENWGCWLWRTPASTGYGPYLAFYEAIYGAVPEGLEVYHECPNGARGCVRPTHLNIAPPGAAVRNLPDPAITVEERTSFARRLRDEQEARKATRWQFARELGVSPNTLRDWTEGRHAPSADQRAGIAKRMGWDDEPRKWAVTLVVQEIVTERSAGQAARRVLDVLDREGPGLKYAVHEVRAVKNG